MAVDCLVKNFTAVVDPLSAILRDVFARTIFKVDLSARYYHVFFIASGRGASMTRDCDLASIGSIRMPVQSTAFFSIFIILIIYRIISNLSNGEKFRLVANSL